MPDRKTGLAATVINPMSNTLIGDLIDMEIIIRNKTAEGKAITDIDDFPVLVGGNWEGNGRFQPLASANSIPLMGTAAGTVPSGTIVFTTGLGSYSGTAIITEARHRVSREDIQEYNLTFMGRGALAIS